MARTTKKKQASGLEVKIHRILRWLLFVLVLAFIGGVVTAIFIFTQIKSTLNKDASDTASTTFVDDASYADKYAVDESLLPAEWRVEQVTGGSASLGNLAGNCWVSVMFMDLSVLGDGRNTSLSHEEETVQSMIEKGYTIERSAGSTTIKNAGAELVLPTLDLTLIEEERVSYQSHAFVDHAPEVFTAMTASCTSQDGFEAAKQALQSIEIL